MGEPRKSQIRAQMRAALPSWMAPLLCMALAKISIEKKTNASGPATIHEKSRMKPTN